MQEIRLTKIPMMMVIHLVRERVYSVKSNTTYKISVIVRGLLVSGGLIQASKNQAQ